MMCAGANPTCQPRLSGRHQTQIFASPPVRTTANTNFRISACHGYPERHLHTTNYQHCLSGRRQTPIFASPLVTATPKDVYTHQLASRRPRAQQLLQKALCTAPAAQTPAAGQAAPTRGAARPGGSVYCACHTNASRGPAGDHARNNFSRLCVMCLPHESQPRATRASRRPRAHNSSRRLCVMRLPHESQPRPSGAHARSSFARRLCVLRLPHGSVL